MQNMSILNHTLGKAIRQEISPDPRNIETFMIAVISLLVSTSVHLSAWISCISGATKAGSSIRRLARWLANSSINHYEWYSPIFRYAMQHWTQMSIFLALDTSMLYDRFCCVRISMIYMNRAIPVTWCVLEHDSASVKYDDYAHLFEQAVVVLPQGVEIFFWPTEVLSAKP